MNSLKSSFLYILANWVIQGMAEGISEQGLEYVNTIQMLYSWIGEKIRDFGRPHGSACRGLEDV
jgi:hypothetical protein